MLNYFKDDSQVKDIQLADLAENNQAHCKCQILQHEKNNELTDIVKDSINGLREGLVFKC